ncbi:uncharacterized protein N7469_007309 [Penicillium citrinum]|uniref:Uncharacterized protein n=1 Tax=Penicillium citrinum TaxID=5077 RepID=A0A9W9NYE8_PENCI|nr:uncharacterized protein N7469_007309 [Penicillium citrinum]KAJ5227303.1 hypothetical protein N7469_007309 [Penicillium citrinum]
MPHKHKRREKDESQFDLPPSVIAKALPVRNPQTKAKNEKKPAQKQDDGEKKASFQNSRRKSAKEDDTPRAFRHLMQFQTTGRRAPPSGLETGEKKKKNPDNKKRKHENGEFKEEANKKPAKTLSEQNEAGGKEAKQAMPKILPGEKLSDFAARVDRALPLSAMTKSNHPGAPKTRDHKMTKHEKHLRRLQAGWREDEAKIREKEQEEREEREEQMEEQLELLRQWDLERRGAKAKKKGATPKKKNKSGNGDVGDDDPDPWAKLKKRDKERQANPFDVAQEPPQLKKPREIFKVRGGAKVDVANVPNAVGSLRRREELASERRNIVEEYRRMMAEKRQ